MCPGASGRARAKADPRAVHSAPADILLVCVCVRAWCIEQRTCAVRSGLTSVKMGGETVAPVRSPSLSLLPALLSLHPFLSFCRLRRGYTPRASARCAANPCSSNSSRSRNVGAVPWRLGCRCPPAHMHAEAPAHVPTNTSGRLEGGSRPRLGRYLLLECPDWRDLLVIVLDSMSVCVCISNVVGDWWGCRI